MYDAEVIFKLLNSHDRGVHTDEAEEPEPEHKKRIMMALKFTEGLGFTEAGVTEFKDVDWSEQGAPTSRQRITRMRVCCQEILKEEEVFVLPYVSDLFLQVIFRDTCITTCIGDDLQEVPLLKLSYVCYI